MSAAKYNPGEPFARDGQCPMAPEAFQAVVLSKLDALQQGQESINLTLNGNGDASKGLVVRVDRLEQRDESRVWWTRATLGVAIGSIGAAVTALFKTGK